jgi:hypothetical protein
MVSSLDSIQQGAVSALRRYLSEPNTPDLKEVARSFVDAREHFFSKDGTPDWVGRTHVYRRWVRETMSLANVPGDEISSLQAAIRYHTGGYLREKLDSDTLVSLGLREASPRERSVEKRERYSEVLSLFGAGPRIEGAEDVIRAAELMESTLRRVSLDAVAKMPKKDREAIREAMTTLCKHADAVAEAADAGGKSRSK